MDVLDAIEQRRAVKHYDSAATMSDEEFQKLMSLVILSPTSYNIQNWRFVRIVDRNLRTQLQEAAWGQTQVTEASEVILLCGDLNAYAKEPQRYWANAPQPTQDFLLPMINNFYHDNAKAQRDECMRSCGLAGQTLMLAAKGMGYDSCPMVGYDPDKVAELIHLPEGHIICMMVVIGKAKKPANPRGGQLKLEEVLVTNRFS